ncbi:MAG: Bug family tripartite tricarboxylate transporter substrate binding protein [Beijerinckiaceae bacterium]
MTKRRTLLLGAMALAAASLAAPVAEAQSYPTRPVRIIVPFGPGGPADIYARAVAQHLGDALKQNFIIENKPGAGAVIGTTEAARAAPDGYTLLMMSNTHTANETLLPARGYVLTEAFVPVAPVNASDLVIVVHPSVPAKTLKEFIDLAKSKPGQFTYASSGNGTPYHLASENFKALTGTDMVHLPHRNSGDARNAVLGGHAQIMMDAVTTTAPTVQAGQVRALATTGDKRSAILPDLPTAKEAGVAGFEATIWLGLLAPAGTPQPIIDQLNAEVRKFQERPEIRDAWAKQGALAISLNPQQFGEYIKTDVAKWKKVIESANIKAQ